MGREQSRRHRLQISPDTNTVVDTIEVGRGPAEIAVVGGIVWVANEADGTLSRIEPGQTPVRTMTIESVPQGLAECRRRPLGLRPWDGDLASRGDAAVGLMEGAARLARPRVSYDNWGARSCT